MDSSNVVNILYRKDVKRFSKHSTIAMGLYDWDSLGLDFWRDELFICLYPLKVQACPPRDKRLALRSRGFLNNILQIFLYLWPECIVEKLSASLFVWLSLSQTLSSCSTIFLKPNIIYRSLFIIICILLG